MTIVYFDSPRPGDACTVHNTYRHLDQVNRLTRRMVSCPREQMDDVGARI
jgi:hypothetical protein